MLDWFVLVAAEELLPAVLEVAVELLPPVLDVPGVEAAVLDVVMLEFAALELLGIDVAVLELFGVEVVLPLDDIVCAELLVDTSAELLESVDLATQPVTT